MSRSVTILLLVSCSLVVAIGGVAAAETTADRSFDDESVPGDTVTVTTTIELEDDGLVDYADEFNPEFEDATIKSLTHDGERITPMLADSTGDGLLVITDELEAGTVEVVFTVEVPDDTEPGDEFEFSGDFRVETDTDPLPVTGDHDLVIEGDDNDRGATGTNDADSTDDELGAPIAISLLSLALVVGTLRWQLE